MWLTDTLLYCLWALLLLYLAHVNFCVIYSSLLVTVIDTIVQDNVNSLGKGDLIAISKNWLVFMAPAWFNCQEICIDLCVICCFSV